MSNRSKRIGLDLLDVELKNLINASAKIFPVSQEDINNNINLGGYEYGRVGRTIYIWQDDKWEYIIADDVDIKWDDVEGKPVSYLPTSHKHTEEDISNLDKYKQSEVDNKFALKTSLHEHTNKGILDKLKETLVHETYDVSQLQYIEDIRNGYTEGHRHDNFSLLNNITSTLISQWSGGYNHSLIPSLHISNQDREVIDSVSGKATKTYVDEELGKKANMSTLTGHTSSTTIHVTQSNKDLWNGKANISDIPTKNSQLTNDSEYVTQADLGSAGLGDMLKSVYDKNNDGVVDVATNVAWSGVTGKPSAFIPSTHTHPSTAITGLPTSLPANGGNADTVNGFTLGMNVPLGSKLSDTIYSHPSKHPASIITQDANNRFVKDTEKTSWNGKAEVSAIPTKLSQLAIDINVGTPTISSTKPSRGGMWYKVIS